MLTWLLLGLTVYLFNIYLPTMLYMPAEGVLNHLGSRDNMPEPSALVARARRSLANFQENLPIFITLALLALVVEGVAMEQAVTGAMVFVVSRIAYIILYVLAVPFLRSAAYTAGLIGLIMIALAVI